MQNAPLPEEELTPEQLIILGNRDLELTRTRLMDFVFNPHLYGLTSIELEDSELILDILRRVKRANDSKCSQLARTLNRLMIKKRTKSKKK